MKKLGIFICALTFVSTLVAQNAKNEDDVITVAKPQTEDIENRVATQISEIERYVELQPAEQLRLAEYFRTAFAKKINLSDTLTKEQRQANIRERRMQNLGAIKKIIGDEKFAKYKAGRENSKNSTPRFRQPAEKQEKRLEKTTTE